MQYKISEIDHQRFGVVTAKASLEHLDDLPSLIEKSMSDHVNLLIIRIPTKELALAQNLELKGAILTDTLVYYHNQNIRPIKIELPNDFSWRYAELKDAQRLEVLALDIFSGYSGHYHADLNLEKQNCDHVYSSWALNSCLDSNVADKVIIIEKSSEFAAFATLKVNSPDEVEGVLFGVSPKHRKIGLHLCLMKLAINWSFENGYKHFVTSTQIQNVYAQKNWTRLGFELSSSFYTFHKWFK